MSISIITAEQLLDERVHDRVDLTVVDARRRRQFEHGHIPGAIWMGWETWCEPAPPHAAVLLGQEGYWGKLGEGSPAEYAQRLAACGLRSDRPIVVYADGAATRGREGRIAWMLLYFGAPAVLLLDGGWSQWLARQGPTEIGAATPRGGRFAVELQRHRRRTLAELHRAHQRGMMPQPVDTRSREEFEGKVPAYLPRRGRLPGAALMPFVELFRGEGRYVDREEYLASLPKAVRDATELVAYCEVGVRASLFALLHEAYTDQVVAVFDGSMVQWALESDLPMTGGGP